MIDRRIKFRHIQSFVEICRQKSLKKAAEKQFLTQPAISKTLKELEQILDTTLLNRNRGGINLTKSGEIFLHFAEMSIAALQQGMYGVEQVTEAGKAKLAIGALPSIAARLMPTIVREFQAMTQDVTLTITDGPHGYLVNCLRQGSLDLVLGRLGDPDTMQGISFTQLYTETVAFIVRPGHPLCEDPDLQKLPDWPVIYPPQSSAIRPLVERFMIANGVGEITNRVESVSGAFGHVFVPGSDSVWIISTGVVASEVEAGRLVALPFEVDITCGPIGLMTRQDSEPSPAERLFRVALNTAVEKLGL